MNDTVKTLPEVIPATPVASVMSEAEYEAIKLHVYHLQGFVGVGDVIELSSMFAVVETGFNVYMQYQEMAMESIVDGKFTPKPTGLEDWLIARNMIRPLDASQRVATSWVFKTYPFAPSYQDILKTGLILTTGVGDENVTKFSTDDLKVYALMRATVSQFRPDPEKTNTVNLQEVIAKLRTNLEANEKAYLGSTGFDGLIEKTDHGTFVDPSAIPLIDTARQIENAGEVYSSIVENNLMEQQRNISQANQADVKEDGVKVAITLDPNDPSPEKTIESIQNEVVKLKDNDFPVGTTLAEPSIADAQIGDHENTPKE